MSAEAPSFERERALSIQQRAMRDWIAMLGGSAASSRLVERDGVAAAVVPACPRRSIANSVNYTDTGALAAALDPLAATYEEAGVAAWTVWTPEFDREAIATLQAAGHKFDGKPMAMVCDLERFEPPDLGGFDYDEDGELSELGRLNEEVYGLSAAEGFASLFDRRPPDLDLRIYRAHREDELACVLATIDHRPGDDGGGEPDCGIYFVATPERHRGHGLATRLLAASLVEAAGRGCATSSLQASAMGEPIYLALGYEPCFRLHMYERRRPS